MADISTIDGSNKTTPADLAISVQPDTDKNYFDAKITNLKINTTYSFQFQWIHQDGSLSEWSPTYNLRTAGESVPAAPTATVPTTSASFIPVTLSTFPADAKRVDVVVIGGAFGIGKTVYSFLSAGSTNIAAGAGTYQVELFTVTQTGINGTPTDAFSITVTDPTANIQSPEPSKTPSVPTVSSVLGAIQVSWDGKQADGSNQPYGFNAAKVYVGTTSGFTPGPTNQVDVLNFANGQNTLDISVGTVVAGTAMTYGTDYYIKIATTNGTDTSTPVSASGNPVRIGQVGNGDIVEITADKIKTGTISTQTITVGAPSGKRVELRGSGNPIEIFGTGGTSLLSYNTTDNKLVITGDGTFTGDITGASGSFSGNISAASGTFTGDLGASGGTFTVRSGIVSALAGNIGGWTINSTTLRSSAGANRIELNPDTPSIQLISSTGNIYLDTADAGGLYNSAGTFHLYPNGDLSIKGALTISANPQYNYWNSNGFRAGGANTYMSVNVSDGSTIMYSSDSQSEITETGSSQGTTSIAIPQQLIVNSSQITIQGLPGVGNGLTATQSLEYFGDGTPFYYITQYRSQGYNTAGNEPTYNYGVAARYRMVVADPYDYNKLKRGLGVYYGTRTSAPGPSTGFVGDLWVSW